MDIYTSIEKLLKELVAKSPIAGTTYPVEYFFNNVTIPVSSSEIISDPIKTEGCSLAWYWISQTASTNLIINVYSESSDTSTDRGIIKPYTLGTSVLTCTDFIDMCPPYIRIGVKNNDTVNATNVTIKIRKTG